MRKYIYFFAVTIPLLSSCISSGTKRSELLQYIPINVGKNWNYRCYNNKSIDDEVKIIHTARISSKEKQDDKNWFILEHSFWFTHPDDEKENTLFRFSIEDSLIEIIVNYQESDEDEIKKLRVLDSTVSLDKDREFTIGTDQDYHHVAKIISDNIELSVGSKIYKDVLHLQLFTIDNNREQKYDRFDIYFAKNIGVVRVIGWYNHRCDLFVKKE